MTRKGVGCIPVVDETGKAIGSIMIKDVKHLLTASDANRDYMSVSGDLHCNFSNIDSVKSLAPNSLKYYRGAHLRCNSKHSTLYYLQDANSERFHRKCKAQLKRKAIEHHNVQYK
jgi:hypothetical protein